MFLADRGRYLGCTVAVPLAEWENVGDVIIAALEPCVEVADALGDGRSGDGKPLFESLYGLQKSVC